MEGRTSSREPIRLAVTYRSAESLVTEYTTCVSKGGCTLVAERGLDLGTRFRFEMYAAGRDQPLELEGEVTEVQPIQDARRFELAIRYTTVAAQRAVLDTLLAEIVVDPSYEARRRYPRIPVNLIAHDRTTGTRCLIRDLSCGGMRVHGRGLARGDAVGARVTLFASSLPGALPFEIGGTVVWAARGTHVVRSRLGIQFDPLEDAELMVIQGMTRLWRPSHLELAFAASARGTRPVDGAAATARFTRTRRDIAALIRDAAAYRLGASPGLGLREVAVDAPAGPLTARARVGLVGDVEGELCVEASPALAAWIASQALGEPVGPEDHALVSDALAELVTGIAGGVCDELDELGVELEVTAPLAGPLEVAPADHRLELALAGPRGRLAVTIVTRDGPRPGWPG